MANAIFQRTISVLPSISMGFSRPITSRMVGAMSARRPSRSSVPAPQRMKGTTFVVCAVMGLLPSLCSDHGNAEQMLQSDGVSPMTAHTTNPVPFILCGAGNELREGRLADIAPTILDVMGLEKPEEMDGQSLILR